MLKPIPKPKNNKKVKKKLEKDCMILWAKIVKQRANYVCEYWGCRKTENLNSHHIFSRSRNSTRYDLDNGICLCSGHHSLLTESAHKDPEFLKKMLGEVNGYEAIRTQTWYQALRMRAYTPQKLDLAMEYLYLQKELDKLV